MPVFANDQDTVRLAALASKRFAGADRAQLAPGYLIAGHGLYAWGATPKKRGATPRRSKRCLPIN